MDEQAEASEPVQSGTSSQLASRWQRLGGAVVDTIIAMVVTLPVMAMFGMFSGCATESGAGCGLGLGKQLIVFVYYYIVFLAVHGYLLSKYGQTVGKKVAGTKIVDMDGNILPLAKVVGMRYMIVGIICMIPVIGAIFGLVNVLFIFKEDKRCIHDLIAGTRVVNA
ncbi:MAG: RDD family protein [Sedimentisphaerales bacterium]|nr:RDD family protein [Sedimentisphaerales bacterium]